MGDDISIYVIVSIAIYLVLEGMQEEINKSKRELS